MGMACKVLIVEDEIAEATLLKRAFRRHRPDMEIDIVDDGGDALTSLLPAVAEEGNQRPRPNFVVLDLKLRRMDGHEVLRRLKDEHACRDIPTVVFSSSSDPDDVSRAYDLGANSYIVKPVRSADLDRIASLMTSYWCEANCSGDANGALRR